MAVNRLHREFHQVDMESGWETPAGFPPGVEQKIISGTLDRENRRGGHTRLLRWAPGSFTSEKIIHDDWEEVFIVSGDLWVSSNEDGTGGEKFVANTYAVRPPGVWHGPFRSEGGALLIEMHYYDPQ